MAMKKIRLDFSKTEERSGVNTRHIPEGLHKMKITSVTTTEAQDGTAMLVYYLVPTEAKYKTRNFPFYCKIQANQLWKLRDLLVAAGQTVPKRALQIDPSVVVGKFIAAEVEDETGQYEGRSTVNATYGLDILDEDGTGSSEPDEEEGDEEYEGDEEEADEEEYEDEDLSELSLPELRKRAKENGVVTTGLKKDDLIEAILEAEGEAEDEEEEDDLDEEDLEDEDLDDEDLYEDDEEEEEAPAPKKRPAAKAPAKKVAPAAPKRRVIRR